MTDELSQIEAWLPKGTAAAWRTLASIIPDYAYLAGGTALTVHLRHRVSRDLDFFTEQPFDTSAIIELVSGVGEFATTLVEYGTVNGLFESTKFQMLDASHHTLLKEPIRFAGIRIASVADLMATKLKVIQDRGALRDYFDIMLIEEQAGLRVEEGLGYLIDRYKPEAPDAVLHNVVRGLGYMGDVEDDPSLPVSRAQIERYWAQRQPQIMTSLG